MNVSELRKKAKEAGMENYSNARKAELEEFLANLENEVVEDEQPDESPTEETPETELEEEQVEETAADESEDEPVNEDVEDEPVDDGYEVNVAVIEDERGREVRRYTYKQHGDDFIDLAYEFAGKDANRKVTLVEEPTKEEIEAKKGPTVERNSDNPNATMVLNAENGHVRTYTLEQHGEEYDTLANEFITGRDGYTIEPVRITEPE